MPEDQAELDVTVLNNPERNRFEAHVGDDLAGVLNYRELPDKIVATHTETLPPYQGKGVGARLVRGALDMLRADGRPVQPRCPYVAAYVRDHPEYHDVVDAVPPPS